jgi:hypothetical protein
MRDPYNPYTLDESKRRPRDGSGIDMEPFIGPDYDPVEIDVCYVQDRNARSVAYSVPYSRHITGTSNT